MISRFVNLWTLATTDLKKFKVLWKKESKNKGLAVLVARIAQAGPFDNPDATIFSHFVAELPLNHRIEITLRNVAVTTGTPYTFYQLVIRNEKGEQLYQGKPKTLGEFLADPNVKELFDGIDASFVPPDHTGSDQVAHR